MMSATLRLQIDKTIEMALAAGISLTITVVPPDLAGLRPECHGLLTLLAKAENGSLSLDQYASLTGRSIATTRAALRGAHRSKEFPITMDGLYNRYDDDRTDGGKMRCYTITDKGRAWLTQQSVH